MLDEIGLVHMNGRIYDPSLGRFLSDGPLVQFVNLPFSWNRYSYVLNNPLYAIDPSGYSLKELGQQGRCA
jgi:RHS repeat-associated protein